MTPVRSESSHALAAADDRIPASASRWLLVASALVLWSVLSRYLSAEWSLSEQYSYGWFVPVLALGLFWLRWPDRPAPAQPPLTGLVRATFAFFVAAGLAALPFIRLVEVANPDWRPLGWIHALLVSTLTLLATWGVGGRRWLRHFAFPILFFLVAVPWPRGIEDVIIQQLMRGVAQVAVDVAALFGVPAIAEGNLIRIGGGVVGVNEACSGVRSLQTSVMFGLLLGELNRFSVGRRAAVVIGAMAVALIANVVRATYLVWVAATRGLAAVDDQHAIIGYFILAAVFAGTLGLSAWLKRGVAPARNVAMNTAGTHAVMPPTWVPLAIVVWLVMAEIGVEAWYRAHERGLATLPRWSVIWPAQAHGFRDSPMSETAARILRFDEGRSVNWSSSSNGETNNRMLYYFRWKPGRNSAQLASDHRPDVCLPAAGLRQVADRGQREWSIAAGRPGIEFHHYEFERRGVGRPQSLNVFYCLAEDVPRAELNFNPYVSAGGWDHIRKRIGVALAGRRNLGQQMLEVVILDADSAEEAEREFGALLPTLLHFPDAT